jgi:four helix bundle protein
MDRKNVIIEKSYALAVTVSKLCLRLQKEKREYVFSKQLLRLGTSIGANVEESQDAQSTKDFVSKLSIALKEARETRFWIRLMRDCELITAKEAQVLLRSVDELRRLLTSIIKTTKVNSSRNS